MTACACVHGRGRERERESERLYKGVNVTYPIILCEGKFTIMHTLCSVMLCTTGTLSEKMLIVITGECVCVCVCMQCMQCVGSMHTMLNRFTRKLFKSVVYSSIF